MFPEVWADSFDLPASATDFPSSASPVRLEKQIWSAVVVFEKVVDGVFVSVYGVV